MQRSAPAGLVEDVDEDVTHEADALADALLVDLVGGGLEGPVDEHGAAYDIFAWDEAPEPAVEAFGAVVAEGEDLAGGNNQVVSLDMARQINGPAGGDVLVGAGGDGGEVVPVRDVGMHGVAVVDRLAGLRLVLGDAVEVDDAVAEVDSIAGDGDGALDQKEVRVAGLQKDDDVSAADVAVVDEGSPPGGWGEGDAIDQDVVADEKRFDHRGGGDLEVLEDEGHDEEADGEDAADGGQGFERGLGVLGLLFGYFAW